ncbi:Aldehyde dehydrogenase [Apiospora arundinis]
MTDYVVSFIIDGQDVRPSATFDVTGPATGKLIHKCGIATKEHADSAVAAASRAFPAWKSTTPSTRRDLLLKAADVMEKRREELADYIKDSVGATQDWADLNINGAIDVIRDVAGRVSSINGAVPALIDPSVDAMVLKEPYGVVLAIAPWNAPYILGTRAILQPIAAGNTTVFKGSELSPIIFWAITSCFQEAGIPNGVINFISTDPAHAAELTSALIENPAVRKVNFTGSTAVGRIIGRLCGQNLKPVVLELGGKAPRHCCVLGAFLFAGQICMSTERILVHKKISAEFQKKLAATIEAIFPAGADAPVLINSNAVDKVKKLLDNAVSKGASVLAGDFNATETSKTRLRPIVISKVTPDMDIYQTESFGPSVSLIEIESEEEALRIANDTEYGLAASVFTEDLRTGLRFAKGIETGAVHINNMTVHDEANLPHGGGKNSGYGRFNTALGLDEYTKAKTITWRS